MFPAVSLEPANRKLGPGLLGGSPWAWDLQGSFRTSHMKASHPSPIPILRRHAKREAWGVSDGASGAPDFYNGNRSEFDA